MARRKKSAPSGDTVGIVVLAGGTSARLGGGDKTALDVGGMSILHRLLTELPTWPTVVVAPDPAEALPAGLGHVRFVRENPPGGGPAVGLAAGAAALPAGVTLVVALAGDQPFAASVVPRLVARIEEDEQTDGVLSVDAAGRRQPLLAVYRRSALKRALALVRSGDRLQPSLAGISGGFIPASLAETLDVDNSADLALARDIVDARGAGDAREAQPEGQSS